MGTCKLLFMKMCNTQGVQSFYCMSHWVNGFFTCLSLRQLQQVQPSSIITYIKMIYSNLGGSTMPRHPPVEVASNRCSIYSEGTDVLNVETVDPGPYNKV